MTDPNFIHLHVRSDYSLIDGLMKINSLIKEATILQFPALALTDFSNIFGWIKFFQSAYINGIKPIIGADFLLYDEKLSKNPFELTVIASNNIGYQNLINLISEAYLFNNKVNNPIIKRENLIKYNNGLILLSGARKGDVGQQLLNNNDVNIKYCLSFYKNYFPSRYYIELVRTGRTNEDNYLNKAIDIACKNNLPVVATNDVRFMKSNDFEAHNVKVSINRGCYLSKLLQDYSRQQYLRSEEEMCKLFSDIPEALVNSVEIARRCNVDLLLGKYFLPLFSSEKISSKKLLIKNSYSGLEKKLKLLFSNYSKEEQIKNKYIYTNRLNKELKIINDMGFSGYFLIVMEFVKWAKSNKIPVGPGRGSGAGSLVAYSLEITDIDPLKFDLLFERFLNPERISMPDFDIDFCMEKRDLVINHVINTYGRDSVSQIITFGNMSAKGVVRDVGRVLGYPYAYVNYITKLIPSNINLKKAITIDPKLKNLYSSSTEIKKIIQMSFKLEGVIRNISTHAGGIVISPTKITDFTPIYYDKSKNNPVTQFDKDDVECIGLVKFDFLGLRTLTIINDTLKLINKLYFKKISISDISLTDQKSFNLLKKAKTTAIFQLESTGIKNLIKKLKPDSFDDLIALIALFRPGPLQSGMVNNFINRKHGKEPISYPDIKWQHELLKPILKSTYGIILYQEQVMKIAQILAGYSLGEADILRIAMGKKKEQEMTKQRLIFKKGAEINGINSKLSMKIFDLMEKFSGYGFNKSHSVAYALISYQTIWLKANYPTEFLCSVMNSEINHPEKLIELIKDCKYLNIKIIPPNINQGKLNFTVNSKNEILYGLGAIKGLGEDVVNDIVNIRNKQGNFSTLLDLCLIGKPITKRILEILIMSGSLDSFGYNRASLIASINNTLQIAKKIFYNKFLGQIDLFNSTKEYSDYSIISKISEWSEQIKFKNEKKTLGVYLTGHPINAFLPKILNNTNGLRLKNLNNSFNGKIVTIAGIVHSMKFFFSKKGTQIGICTLDDNQYYLDIIFFKDMCKKYFGVIKKDVFLMIKGKVTYTTEVKVIFKKLITIKTY